MTGLEAQALSLQSSTQETGQELTDGVLGSIPLKDGQEPPTAKRLARARGECWC